MSSAVLHPPVLIVPGLGGSGPDHWQSIWQREVPNAERVEQADWDRPVPSDWLRVLAHATAERPGAVVVAHSLGCILLAHLVERQLRTPIAAALLVAPADVEADGPERETVKPFAPVPLGLLPFPSLVVASGNDPFVTPRRAALFARAWGSVFVDVGACGHINVAAGFGPWPDGRGMLDRLIAQAREANVGSR